MAQQSHLYLAVYDITENRERDRVAGVLEGWGVRVQESVFEVRLTKATQSRLWAQLEALGVETGYVFLYRVDGKAKRKELGRPPENPLAEERHAFVL